MENQLEALLIQLNSLDKTSLQKLYARIGFLLDKADHHSDWPPLALEFYDSLYQTMADKYLRGVPFSVLISSPSTKQLAKQYTKILANIQPFLEQTSKNCSKTTRHALFRLFVDILINDLDRRHINLSPRILITNLGQIPALVHDQFPSYAVEKGLFAHILKNKSRIPNQ